MLKAIEGLPDGVVGVEASGKVTAEDCPVQVFGNDHLADAKAWVSG